MMQKNDKVIITGAGGLVGQNLVVELIGCGYTDVWAIDKNEHRLGMLKKFSSQVHCIIADLAEDGDWSACFVGAETAFLLQAQITGLEYGIFQRNTLDSTERVIAAIKKHSVPFTVFVGSSVVKSVADDNYTRSKIRQEQIMSESGLPYCTLRPTLMFGWFDPKHFGWLSRFMEKIPVFPIPGHGRYMRQPLYVRDFCHALAWCAEHRPVNAAYDIVGQEDVTYIDIIKTIKKIRDLKTCVISIPVPLFRWMMRIYALFSKNPPFVADQLDALMAGDYFTGHNMEQEFGIKPTPFIDAIRETFTHPVYSGAILE